MTVAPGLVARDGAAARARCRAGRTARRRAGRSTPTGRPRRAGPAAGRWRCRTGRTVRRRHRCAAATAPRPVRASPPRRAASGRTRLVGRGGRPRLGTDPAAAAHRVVRARAASPSLIQARSAGSSSTPVSTPAQPAVPPPQGLLQEPDRRPRREATVRVLVRPRPDDALHRGVHVLHEPEHGVAVGVRPAADREHRGARCRRSPRQRCRAASSRRAPGAPATPASSDGSPRGARASGRPTPAPTTSGRGGRELNANIVAPQAAMSMPSTAPPT